MKQLFFIFSFFGFDISGVIVFHIIYEDVDANDLLLNVLLLNSFRRFLKGLYRLLRFHFSDNFIFAFRDDFRYDRYELSDDFIIDQRFITYFFGLLANTIRRVITLITDLCRLFGLAIDFNIDFYITCRFLSFVFIRAEEDLSNSLLLFATIFVFHKGIRSAIDVSVRNGFSLQRTTQYQISAVRIRLAREFIVDHAFAFALRRVSNCHELIIFDNERRLTILNQSDNIFHSRHHRRATRNFSARERQNGIRRRCIFRIADRGAALGDDASYCDFIQIGIFAQLFAGRLDGFLLGR